MGVLCIEARDFDDGAATEEKMCRGGVGVLYGGQRRRSVGVAQIMGNGTGFRGRAGGGRWAVGAGREGRAWVG
jgi:hypothetical protein